MSAGYRILPLKQQDRAGFACGAPALDRYLREQAGQDMRRRIATCFLAMTPEGAIAGFYTLAATSLPLDGITSALGKKLPRYSVIPAVLLGRLAVAKAHQGKHLGAALVADALLRAGSAEIAAHLMVVDAKDEKAARFYEHMEFMRLEDGRRLIRAL